MYCKIKNTLASLAVALSLVGVSYSIGHPPTQAALGMDDQKAGVTTPLDELQAANKSLRGIRSQLSMPFYSFAPLLPRREG